MKISIKARVLLWLEMDLSLSLSRFMQHSIQIHCCQWFCLALSLSLQLLSIRRPEYLFKSKCEDSFLHLPSSTLVASFVCCDVQWEAHKKETGKLQHATDQDGSCELLKQPPTNFEELNSHSKPNNCAGILLVLASS